MKKDYLTYFIIGSVTYYSTKTLEEIKYFISEPFLPPIIGLQPSNHRFISADKIMGIPSGQGFLANERFEGKKVYINLACISELGKCEKQFNLIKYEE